MGFLTDKFLEEGKTKKSQSLKKGYTEAKKYHILQNLIPITLRKMLASSVVVKQTKEAVQHFIK